MVASLSFQPKYLGQSVPRVEDPLLLTGRAPHIDDLQFPGMLHAAFLRSPYAHARIVSIDVSAARELPGVELVLTGEEYRQHAGPLSGLSEGFQGWALAVDKVRYAGEPVAVVVAVDRYVAEDAVQLIQVEYDPLPAVVDGRRALEPDAPLLYEDRGTNQSWEHTVSYGDTAAALASADLVVKASIHFPRVSGNPMETLGCISQWDALTGEYTSWSNTQIPRMAQLGTAAGLGVPPSMVKVHAQPHGGSFGVKGAVGKYITVTCVLSKLVGGRPVKYIEDRIEHLMASGTHAWDRFYEAEFGFTKDGRCIAMKFHLINDIGASSEGGGPSQALKPIVVLTGAYDVPNAEYTILSAVTNKSPEGAYRGYGPPPHYLVMERLMDKAAAALGLDPAEIRRRNFIQPDQFPYKTLPGHLYDSGDYPEVLRVALEAADYEGLRREQERLRAEGRLVGLSVVFGVEPGGAWGFSGPYRVWPGAAETPMSDTVTVRFDLSGTVEVELYQALEGQGQPTFAAQLIADYFGVPMEMVKVRQADPGRYPPSFGPGGSRQAVTLSWSLIGAADRLSEKLRKAAGALLEVDPEDLEIAEGAVRVKGSPEQALPLAQVVGTMQFRPDLLPPDIDANPEITYVWNAPGQRLDSDASPYLTFANACHVVMVEIDPDTGQVSIPKYVIADDCGMRLNPAVVEGMTQGGVAQGIGCALLEEYAYDENGVPLAATYMDYLLPTIYDVPMTEKHEVVTPSPFHPLGAKGAGEGAIHLTPAAVFCAVNDALAPLGVELTEGGASPLRLWNLMQQARTHGGAVT